MYRILVVEDDRTLNEGVCYALRKEGNLIYSAYNLKEAREALCTELDLVILDINLPDGDGRTFLKTIRQNSQIPVVMLTARDSEEDMVRGFDTGCDDYITKPFSTPLLLRRVQAVLKRTGKQGKELYCSGDLTYHFQQKELKCGGEAVNLTATEYRLLEMFLENRNQVLTREQILDKVWDTYENYVDEKTLSVNIRRLREKVEENPKEPKFILTVFGIGYKWSDNND